MLRIQVLKVKSYPIKFRESFVFTSVEAQFSPEIPVNMCVKMEMLNSKV